MTPPNETKRTTDADAYFSSPQTYQLEGRRFRCASPDARLFLLVAWGHLELHDLRELLTTLKACERHGPRERLQLVILRDVVAVAPQALAELMRYYASRPAYLGGIAKEAVVRPEGVVALLAEGFHRVVPLPFAGRVFTSERRALEWLGLGSLGPWVAEIREGLLRRTHPGGPLLAALADLLRRDGAGLTLADAARPLGMSPRTLQRRLRAAGTTFASERAQTLVEAAKLELRDTDADIKRIALELGFAAPQRFSELFARETGLAPASWRAAQRRELASPGGSSSPPTPSGS